MLLTDGFGGFGGIAKFNRDFMQALDASPVVARVYALPRLIPDSIEEPIPESVVYDRKAARGKLAFVRRVLRYARGPTARQAMMRCSMMIAACPDDYRYLIVAILRDEAGAVTMRWQLRKAEPPDRCSKLC
jgi:hypothetical protein